MHIDHVCTCYNLAPWTFRGFTGGLLFVCGCACVFCCRKMVLNFHLMFKMVCDRPLITTVQNWVVLSEAALSKFAAITQSPTPVEYLRCGKCELDFDKFMKKKI